jgi:hypothetical protein
MLGKLFNCFKKKDETLGPQAIANESRVPTREQMLEVFLGMCNGKIPTKLGIAYYLIRETHGHNRSPHIDTLIKRQGGTLGDPYCMWGMQECLDELCDYYAVNRRLVLIPEGGATQTVFARTVPTIKKQIPMPMTMVFWRQNSNHSRGHVGMVVSDLAQNSSFRVFEFNTNISNQNEVVRDGEGAGFVTRRLNGTQTMTIIGYVDVYQAMTDIIKREGVMI